MNVRRSLIATACLFALAACGGESDTAATDTAAVDTAPAATGDAPATDAGLGADSAAACETTIDGNDAMKFSTDHIAVPASCTEFTITLRHVGQMPVNAMGHNVVVSAASDVADIAADGMAAGVENGYLQPDDARVIAHTDLVGGGEQASVTFDVSKIANGEFKFFCSFPGHPMMMNGTIAVE